MEKGLKWAGMLMFGLVFSAWFSSCYYDVEENLYGPVEVCDTLTVPTFSGRVFPVLQQNCLGCHNGVARQGGINLETYADVKRYVDNQLLIRSVKHVSGVSPMPKGGRRLNDCIIKDIERWISRGAPND